MIASFSDDIAYIFGAEEITQTATVISKEDIFENPIDIQVIIQSGRQSHFRNRSTELNPDTEVDVLVQKADYVTRRRGDIVIVDGQRYIVADIDDINPVMSRLSLTRQMGLIPKRI